MGNEMLNIRGGGVSESNIIYPDFNLDTIDAPHVTKIRAAEKVTEWVMVIGYDENGAPKSYSGCGSVAEQLMLLEKIKLQLMGL